MTAPTPTTPPPSGGDPMHGNWLQLTPRKALLLMAAILVLIGLASYTIFGNNDPSTFVMAQSSNAVTATTQQATPPAASAAPTTTPAPADAPLPMEAANDLGPGACMPSFDNANGLNQVATWLRAGSPESQQAAHRTIVWMQTMPEYYGGGVKELKNANDLADWYQNNTVLVQTSEMVAVQNTYCDTQAVHSWRPAQLQRGTWLVYLKGDNNTPVRPVQKAVCGNMLFKVKESAPAAKPAHFNGPAPVVKYVPVTHPAPVKTVTIVHYAPPKHATPPKQTHPVPPTPVTPPKHTPTCQEQHNCKPSTCEDRHDCKPTTCKDRGDCKPTTCKERGDCKPSTCEDRHDCKPTTCKDRGDCKPTPPPSCTKKCTPTPPKQQKPPSQDDDMLNGKGPFHPELKQTVSDNHTSGVDTGSTKNAPKEPTSSPKVDDSKSSGKSDSDNSSKNDSVGSTTDSSGKTTSNGNSNTTVGSDNDHGTQSNNSGDDTVSAFD